MRTFTKILILLSFCALPIQAQHTYTDKEIVDLANYVVDLQRTDSIQVVQIEILEQIMSSLKHQAQIDSVLLFSKDVHLDILEKRVSLYKELYEEQTKIDNKSWKDNKYLYYFYGVSTILISSWVVGNVR